MGVLTYSALSKIGKILKDQYSDADSSKIISKEVTVDYSEINIGNEFTLNLGELPEDSILVHSQVNINTIFKDSSDNCPKMSVGLENIEDDEIDFPVDNYQHLIFEDLFLNNTGVIDAQGTLLSSSSTSKRINKYINNLIVRFNMMGVWSSGGDLNTTRRDLTGCGTQSAGLSIGGYTTSRVGTCEEYNGSSWSATGSLILPRHSLSACGDQNAGLCFGGTWSGGGYRNETEEYNGASWSAGGTLSLARDLMGGCGTQGAALSFAGRGVIEPSERTEEYDGASWSNSNDVNIPSLGLCGFGLQNAAVKGGGHDGSANISSCEEYNGTTWAIINNLNTASKYPTGHGRSYAGLSNGGYSDTYIGTTEEFDGTSWISSNDSNSYGARGGSGSQSAALVFGGYDGNNTPSTEEYDPASLLDLTQGSLSLYVTYAY